MKKFTESKLLKSIKIPHTETTLANWLEKRRNQRIKALEERENLIRRTAYKLWEEDGKPNNNSEYYWFKAIQTQRPIRRLAAWWEATPIEKLLEDVEFFLKNAALLEIINLVANVTIIISLGTWLATEKQRRNAEIYQAWQVITAAHDQSGDGGRIEALEFLNSEPSRFPWFWIKWEKRSLRGLSVPKAFLYEIELQEADLMLANFQKAILGKANLQKATLLLTNLQEAILKEANLQEANLFQTNLQKAFLEKANLQKAFLFQTNLQGAFLVQTNLQEAFLVQTNLQEAFLKEANLQKSFLFLTNLQEANLEKADLQEAFLVQTNLQTEAILAILKEANLQKILLYFPIRQEPILEKGTLQEAILKEANLQKATLLQTNLQEAILDNANLQEAILFGANLTHKQIKTACFWEKAIYKGGWNDEKETYVAIEPDNTNFIEELKKDKSSDPKKPIDCTFWEQ